MGNLTKEQLIRNLAKAKQKVVIGSKYVHYKNKEEVYVVADIALLENTGTPCIVYHRIESPQIKWVRPINNFLGRVKLSDSTLQNRFTLIES